MPLSLRSRLLGSRGAFAACALALVLAAGCSDSDSPVGPDGALNQENADDAAVQTSIALAGLHSTLDATTSVGTSTTADTTWTQGNLTFHLSRRWFDAAGVAQPLPTATTDSIAVTTRITGSDSTAQWAATVGHAGTLGIGGLSPARSALWIDATRGDTLQTRFTRIGETTTRWFAARMLTTVQDVRWTKPADPSQATYPSAGTITLVMSARRFTSAERTITDRTFDAVVLVTFNGTRFAHATVNGVFHYLIDLETGAVTRDAH